MKKLISNLVSIAAICTLLMNTSCKDDDKDMPAPTVALLTAHTWTFADYDFPVTDPLILSVAQSYKEMLMGTEITFNKNNTIMSSFDMSGNGTWKLSDDEKKITIVEGDFRQEFKIETLNETTLALSEHSDYFNVDISTTYTKK